ncbi:MAG: alpha/beta fold hydrolase [Steroidobacteraceae bacterium]
MPAKRLHRFLRSPARTLVLALVAASAAGWPAAAIGRVARWPASVRPDRAQSHKQVGSLLLQACGRAAYCGHLERPLDPSGIVPGRISIHFEFYPHSGPGDSAGTLVATEGGPGYPATESRDDYLALFRPLMSDHDVLIMDNRGTGQSAAIDCHDLQTAERWTVESVAGCGASLGDRASLYSTAYAADDLSAVLEALRVRLIDLYGDSYGTYFEQTFAIRHPGLLRSIVLDGAYPLSGPDYAWYPTYAPAMREKFKVACARSAGCASLPGNSIDHIMPALEQLRASPFHARGYDVDGRERDFQADASQLATVMFASAPAFTTVRETDAAARAFAQGDRLPLLRLMAETVAAVDSRDPTADAAKWSAGLAAAVMCQDPPQIFDMRLPPAERARDRDRALVERARSFPDTYAPFTIDEYRAMPLDYSFIDQCVAWPVSPLGAPASQAGVNAAYPDVPALVISGELDNITTLADGAAVAAAFRRGVQVRIFNSFHVNALPRARSPCAADIVRRFVRTLATGSTACASRVPPVRLVQRFAVQSAELEPAHGLPGNAAAPQDLQLVTAAVLTVGDVLARVHSNSSGHGAGLRGGAFRLIRRDARIRVSLDRVRWVNDVAVSGTIDAVSRRNGAVQATLQVSPVDGKGGRLTLTWPNGANGARVRIKGAVGGANVVAQCPAP